MVKNLYVHVGLHKTGTSTLQNFMNSHSATLRKNGILVPQSGWMNGAHHKLCYDVLRQESDLSVFVKLRDEIAEADTPNILLSSEEFERFSAAQVHIFKREVGIEMVYPILYLRRQDEYIVSDYGQQVKMGASLPDLDTYLDGPTSAWRFNYLYVVGNWGGAGLGHKGRVMSYELATSTGLLKTFIKALNADSLFTEREMDAAPEMNVSWSAEETDLVRRTTLELRKKTDVPSAELYNIYQGFYPEIQAFCKKIGKSRLGLTGEQFTRVSEQYQNSNVLLMEYLNWSEDEKQHFLFETQPRHMLDKAHQNVSEEQVVQFARRVSEKIAEEA